MKRLNLAIRKAFTTSCFDLENRVGSDAAATGRSPFGSTGYLERRRHK
jgi:hypothetical protein